MLPRSVGAETLDGLAAHDPAAQRSRRDLRRLHRWMGTRSIVVKALRHGPAPARPMAPLRVLELGAGDGSLMLGVARALAPAWPSVDLTLLDRQALVEPATVAAYARVGWTVTTVVVDVVDWARGSAAALPGPAAGARWNLVVANLFLHHFEAAPLALLLGAVAARSDRFLACEPRRGWLALVGSHLVGAIGANAVTREDAVLSVHAGFRARELSALWPAGGEGAWSHREHPAGLFSHCFFAQRLGVAACAPNLMQ